MLGTLWKKQTLETLGENLRLPLVGELLSTGLYRHVRCLHEVRIPSPGQEQLGIGTGLESYQNIPKISKDAIQKTS